MRNLFQLLLSLLVLGAMAWIAWQGYLLLDSKGEDLTAVQRSLLIVAGLLVIVCTFILSTAIRTAGRNHASIPLQHRRTELYETFLHLWLATQKKVMEEGGTHLDLEADELMGSLGLYAGTEVLTHVNELVDCAAQEGIDQCEEIWGKLLLAMRADLGNANYYPLRHELPKLFAHLNKTHVS